MEVTVRNSQMLDQGSELDSKTVMTDGNEISTDRGDSAMMRVGQFIEYKSLDAENELEQRPILAEAVDNNDNTIKLTGPGAQEVFDHIVTGNAIGMGSNTSAFGITTSSITSVNTAAITS